MPKSRKEKQLNAIEGYEKAIVLHQKNLANGIDGIEADAAKTKIANLQKLIDNTKAALNRY